MADPKAVAAFVAGGPVGGYLYNKIGSDVLNGKQGSDAGNVFNNPDQVAASNKAVGDVLAYQGDQNMLDPSKASATATSNVQNNPMLSSLFSPEGTLDRTAHQEQDLSQRGFSLQPEDYEAYGQGMGNIARNFDTSEGNLAQSLSARGLSNSGVAASQFAGSQGSKLEQLGQLQRQIANDRMQTNIQRLGQTRNFLSQMGAQGEQAIQGEYGRGMGAEQQRFSESQGKGMMGMGQLTNLQQQNNNQYSQQQASRTPSLFESLTKSVGALGQAAPSMAAKGALA